ncbi:hypothetical protein MUO14_17255 [Halobacillus shinanisalinarum]|uniref:Uncharacterized protein n=1 Tax=Halobacillus shinanisalinarum TaxID=2932258 RepID=A0ABY4GW76_9BACI|nr:hypothetical protein [Halobacillus shinanisalinarum]UOQ92219.1 hypothetical protein MUO14_17255 [Halobacillus shinanisalinarum]
MSSYLIGYILPEKNDGHEDPMLREFTYGESGFRANILKNKVSKDDLLFFHRMIYGRRYVTAYYVVEDIRNVREIKQDPYYSHFHNPHLEKNQPGED